jgi:tetratricopeptide (TPR) repeat protein
MDKPTVFISYSHKDEAWKDRLVTQLRVLQMEGMLGVWDDRRIEAGLDWFPEIEQVIRRASVAILLVSADFLTSDFIRREEVPRLLERRQKEGLRVTSLIVRPCAWKEVKWLSSIQARPKDGRPLSGGSEYQIEEDLAALAKEVAAIVRRAGVGTAGGQVTRVRPEKISTAKLPSTRLDLFGRQCELATLDAAWDNPRTNTVALVAFGGVGKTALVNVWLNRMDAENWRGAERVFGWSFYSQGAAEGRQASADPFIDAALRWFGDPDPAQGSPWDKGERLAELVRARRTLLVLDGLEPLQYPPGGALGGRLKDPALESLLRELARDNPGLCVLTTRLAVDDLKDFAGFSVETIDLENLAPEDGARYFERLGVKGTLEELRQAAQELDGHALALTLLGTYLVIGYDGDILRRDLVPRLTAETGQGPHARRVMEAYERWFEGKPELDILRLMGLFDRPAEPGALNVLRRPPAIPGLTERLQNLSEYEWNVALDSLRQARLLDPKDPLQPCTLDCHPLVREHFGEKLKLSNPAAWKEAHRRLYEYFKRRAKELPDTLEEMAPLYAAVVHGCEADCHQEAFDEVYCQRVLRGDEQFSTRKLGAWGAELVAVSSFFDRLCKGLVADLSEYYKAWIPARVGFVLGALGRPTEAIGPMKTSLEQWIEQRDWGHAAIAANVLSELHLSMGDLAQALDFARQGVGLGDRTDNASVRTKGRTYQAHLLHQTGRHLEASVLFNEAEEIQQQKQTQSDRPLLCSVQGFHYCDLLLDQGNYNEVQNRATRALAIATQDNRPDRIGLYLLCLGRAYLLQTQQEGTGDFTGTEERLAEALHRLRQAGRYDYLPLGLLARTQLYRVKGEFGRARRDLDESTTIATRGGMRLYQADCRLEYTRLYLAMGKRDEARESFAIATKMIEGMGYHRRDREVQEIEKQLK